MLTLAEIKNFIRVEHSEDDAFLSSLSSASTRYIINSTNKYVNTNSELFKIAQRFLIAHWYENRSLIGNASKIAFHLESILVQLSYETDYAYNFEGESTYTIIVDTEANLYEIPAEYRKVGWFYITTVDDLIWLWDSETNLFTSSTGTATNLDSGTF